MCVYIYIILNPRLSEPLDVGRDLASACMCVYGYMYVYIYIYM